MNKELRIKNNGAEACRRHGDRDPSLHSPQLRQGSDGHAYSILHSPSRSKLNAKRSTLNARVNPRSRVQDCTRRSGFTLLELIIVLAILTILISATVFVLDPLEMVDRARDNNRLTDMEALAGAIRLAKSDAPMIEESGFDPDAGNTNTCVGESSQTVYVSVPLDNGESDPTNLPTGWSYDRVIGADLQNIDGSGWLPVNFASGASGSPISNLPIDPENTFASGYYYEYVCGRSGTYELNTRLVAERYRTGGDDDQQSDDGGDDIFAYEAGGDLSLNPKPPIGYWALDEGTGTSTVDSAGNYGGTLVDGPTWVTSGCIRGNCLLLDGLNDRVQTITSDPFEYRGEGLTTVAWHRPASTDTDWGRIFSNPWNGSGQYNHRLEITAANQANVYLVGATAYSLAGTNAVSEDKWHQFAMTVDDADLVQTFIDGSYDNSGTHAIADWTPSSGDLNVSPVIGCLYPYGSGWAGNTTFCVGGEVDEVAFYDRALTEAELGYQYEALKP